MVKCVMCGTESENSTGWFMLPDQMGVVCSKHTEAEIVQFISEKKGRAVKLEFQFSAPQTITPKIKIPLPDIEEKLVESVSKIDSSTPDCCLRGSFNEINPECDPKFCFYTTSCKRNKQELVSLNIKLKKREGV